MSTASPTLGRLLGSWTLDPALLCALASAGGLYLWGTHRARSRWPARRTGSFLAGLLTLGVALASGIDRSAEELLSVHVVQHLLLALLAPALLLCGAPVRLALSASPPLGRRAIGRLMRRRWVSRLLSPAFGLAAFAAVTLGTEMSGVFEAALSNGTLHSAEHAAYFWSGALLLAPLVAADPIPHPPSAIARFAWLMAAMVAMSVPSCALLLGSRVRYPFYLAPAHALQISALADQRTAGMIMLAAGGAITAAIAIVIAMAAMIAEERRQRRRDSYVDRRPQPRRHDRAGDPVQT